MSKHFVMDELLMGRIKLSEVRASMQIALHDLETKAPHKVELIESQRKGIDVLTETLDLIHRLEMDNKMILRSLLNEQKINLEHVVEKQFMKDRIELLMNV